MTMSSAMTSISCSRCEDSSTVPPRSAYPRSRSRIQRMPAGSSPLAGSSRISTSGSPIRAVAMPSRCRMPREYSPTRREASAGVRLTAASISSTRVPRQAHQALGQRQDLAAGATGVLRGRVQQDAHLEPRVGQVREPPPGDRGGSGRGPGEPDHDPHRGRLAGAVRAEESGHPARGGGEADVVDREGGAVLLRESVDGDHAGTRGAWVTTRWRSCRAPCRRRGGAWRPGPGRAGRSGRGSG